MDNIAQIRAKRPDWSNLSDDSVVNVIRQSYYPDLTSEQIASEIGIKKAAAPAVARTWGEAAADTGRAMASGVGGLVKGAGTLYGLASGDMDNGAVELGDSVQKYWEEGQSSQLKAKKQARSDAIDAQESTGGKAWEAFKQTVTDPALAADVVASNVTSFIPGAVVGRAGSGITAARGLYGASRMGPASLAAREAVAATAGRVGTGAAIGTMALQQGADVSGEVYASAMKKPDAAWAENPEFMAAVEQSDGSDEAIASLKHDFALSAARATLPAAAAVSVAANAIPGGRMLEQALVGGAAKQTLKAGASFAIPKAIAKGGLGEATGEAIEEGGGALAGNMAKQRFVDPNQDLSENVGENAGMGAAGGLLSGGPAGAFHRPAPTPLEKANADREAALAPVAAKAAEGGSPLSAAAVAGNTGALAEAEFASQFAASEQQALAQQPIAEPAPPPDGGAARLAELEAIGKNQPARQSTDDEGRPITIKGSVGRFFTAEERAEYQALSEARDATPSQVPDDLKARAAAISEQARTSFAMDALRAPEAPMNTTKFVNDLAIANSPSTSAALREQAMSRLEIGLEWASANPAAKVASGLEQAVGPTSEGSGPKVAKSPAEQKAQGVQLRAGVDRDAELQGQINAATTRFDKDNLRTQAQTNQGLSFGLTGSDKNKAQPLPEKREQLSNTEQAGLESAAMDGKAVARKAEDAPRQAVISNALKSIEARGGVASPAEAKIVAEAGMGKPYDRIDTSLAPALTADQRLQQATGIVLDKAPRSTTNPASKDAENSEAGKEEGARLAAQDRANARGTAGIGKRIVVDTPAKAVAPPPLPKEVMATLKIAPFQRTAEDKVRLQSAGAGYRADQMALMETAANNPSAMTPVDKLKLRELEIKRSRQRSELESSTIVPNSGTIVPNLETTAPEFGEVENVAAARVVAPEGNGPAIFRKRKAELAPMIASGMTAVERRPDGFYLVDSTRKRQHKLQGPADAQLARKAIKDRIDAAANQAATSPLNKRAEPSGPQIDAVNWKKGEPLKYFGQTIVIENPAGSERKSKPGAPKPWTTLMKHHYGDIAGTRGADGDPVDVFIGYGSKIFVIDQVNKDGSFDEHKVMMGFDTESAARAAYLSNYEKGWTGLGAITEMAPADFGQWVKSDAATKPLGDVDGKPGQRTGSNDPARTDAGRPDVPPGVASAQPGSGVRDDGSGGGVARVAGRAGDGFVPVDAGSPVAGDVTIQVDGQRRKLALVEPNGAEPGNAEKTASERRPGGGRNISGKNASMMQALAKLFGKDVKYFRDTKIGDGFVTPGEPDTIFLNESSTINPVAVFGHEFLHQLKDVMPEVHAALMKAVNQRLKKGSRAAFRRDYSKDKSGNDGALTAGELEEITSDIGGNLMADTTFWKEVFDQIQKDNPDASKGYIAQLAEQLYSLLNKLLGSLKGDKFNATELVNDLETLRGAFKSALAQYIQQQGISQAAMQAEILKAGQKAKLSTTRDMFAGDLATKRSTIKQKIMVDTRGASETIVLGNINSAGQQITATKQGLENFHKWFGDSLAVDQKGRPLVMYHSTNGDIRTFESGRKTTNNYGILGDVELSRTGIFMTPEKSFSQEYVREGDGGNVMQVYAKLENPFDLRSGVSEAQERELVGAGISSRWLYDYRQHDWEMFDNSDEGSNAFTDALKSLGYDGAIFNEEGRDEKSHVTYVAFKPEQIKSATGNRGTFGSDNKDITKSPARNDLADNPKDDNQPMGKSGGVSAGPGDRDGQAPSYGQALPGSTSAVAVHFSTGSRKTLSSQFYGRGYKGLEAERLSGKENDDIRPRVFFYVDTGKGVQPEAGVGGIAHQTELKNLYDVRKDGKEIVKKNPGANNWERAVMEAGYDGYLNNDPRRNQGFAVLLGKKHGQVPAQQIPKPGFSEAAPAETAIKKGLMSGELSAVEVGNIPGATLAKGTLTVPEASREAANDEMMRIGSPVRFSPARDESQSSEYASVAEKYRGSATWMKAPNGEDTQLTERQWVHVRTPAFKAWFGDWEKYAGRQGGVWNDDKGEVSKAAGPDGEPLVVYHGTDKGGFSAFNQPSGKKRGDLGIFTTSNWRTASSYVTTGRYADRMTLPTTKGDLQSMGAEFREEDGEHFYTDQMGNEQGPFDSEKEAVKSALTPDDLDPTPGVYALFMNIRNPNEDHFEGATWTGERVDQWQVKDESGEPIYAADGSAFMDRAAADTLAEEADGAVEPADNHFNSTDDVVREARSYKNDGAIMRQVVDDGPGNGAYDVADVFVALDPNQLKSADFNNGEYSLSQDDIRMSPGRDQTDTPEFKKWFGKSVVVDSQGRPQVMYRGEHGVVSSNLQSRLGSISFGDYETASTYAMEPNTNGEVAKAPRVMPAYLKISNPFIDNRDDPFLDMSTVVDKLGIEEAKRIAIKYEDDIEYTGNWMENDDDLYAGLDSVTQLVAEKPELIETLYFNAYKFFDDAKEVAKLKALGFDGAVHLGNGISGHQEEFKIFDPSQAKSAIGNNGNFDGNKKDITQSPARDAAPAASGAPQPDPAAQRALGDLRKRLNVLQSLKKCLG